MVDKREQFLRIYANIPEDLRKDILVVVEGKTYSWSVAFLEVKDNTALGQKILKTLEEIGVL